MDTERHTGDPSPTDERHQLGQAEILLSQNSCGSKATISGAWSCEVTDFLKQRRVRCLNLGNIWTARNGFSSVEFLRELVELESLILVSSLVLNDDPINSLTNLRELVLRTSARNEIQLDKMPRLERLDLCWGSRFDGLSRLSKLASLRLDQFVGRNLLEMPQSPDMIEITLDSSRVESLEGLERYQDLKNLTLARLPKISSLQPLSTLGKLEFLRLQKCKGVRSLAEVGKLSELRCLVLDDMGRLESICPVVSCRKLEELQVIGLTQIADGDVDCLRGVLTLRKLWFRDGRRYNAKREQLQEALGISEEKRWKIVK